MPKKQTMRISRGYQKNQMKKIMQDLDVPDIDIKKTKQTALIIIACSIALMVALSVMYKVPGALVALVIDAIAIGVFIKDLSDKQKKVINAYKTMGFTKEEYISSLEKANVKEVQKKAMISLWDKVPEPEKVITPKGKPQQVNQSKQNKKKRKYKKKK